MGIFEQFPECYKYSWLYLCPLITVSAVNKEPWLRTQGVPSNGPLKRNFAAPRYLFLSHICVTK